MMTPRMLVNATVAAERERREKLHAKRIAALDDQDHRVLALIGINPGVFKARAVATLNGRRVINFYLEDERVQRSVDRLRRLRWIRINGDRLELRRARQPN